MSRIPISLEFTDPNKTKTLAPHAKGIQPRKACKPREVFEPRLAAARSIVNSSSPRPEIKCQSNLTPGLGRSGIRSRQDQPSKWHTSSTQHFQTTPQAHTSSSEYPICQPVLVGEHRTNNRITGSATRSRSLNEAGTRAQLPGCRATGTVLVPVGQAYGTVSTRTRCMPDRLCVSFGVDGQVVCGHGWLRRDTVDLA
ncbi:hypothetical protein WN48_09975 [Eufriesea mexicana]|uniref:Uncharacterized protein n=1 Tax=Eufriesea mexicana TaxID=516756 RepID=A0A310SIM8_9HYME|nr:hypothetical protein WN48_09975 [Eufriesea mexicana]